MKKIIGLTVAALMVMGLVGGGTWAYFSDPEVTGVNVLSAGTLDLDLNDNDNTGEVIVTVPALYPGGAGNGTVKLTNSGSIAGELEILFGTINDAILNEGATEFATGTANLSSYLEVAMFVDTTYPSDGWDAGADYGITSSGTYTTGGLQWETLDNFDGVTIDSVYGAGTLGSTETDDFVLEWRLPTTVGNEVQSNSSNLTITFTLEQPEADS
jgi:predicted ribosomally synthesized peptide with SipW-like signal peptide